MYWVSSFFSIVGLTFLFGRVDGQCQYIRKDDRAYQLNACSFSSNASGSISSWGFYCDVLEMDDGNETETVTVAVLRRWDTVDCPDEIAPLEQYYVSDCEGADDDCYCGTDEQQQASDTCTTATVEVGSCGDDDAGTQRTNYVTYECKRLSEDSSQQTVCQYGNELSVIQYETDQCDGHGFSVNTALYDTNSRNPEICVQIECPS
eukprot:CAMPEP_0202696024 /NCGR_PEP_ID=MMETSP1385-20130828/9413_1 /ASSEMBLY_ACC=CAM_ASM_000861 /TAXON_ID=933848 /ORGANISM="Elphidium margaritaceum" /LENGTH=204 /DNA_ID=CAMNT_0049352119 /DNA_START=1 /DNA_END=611 /DNA_ORIENTATION=+